jgi:RNA polymerase sigma-B factor
MTVAATQTTNNPTKPCSGRGASRLRAERTRQLLERMRSEQHASRRTRLRDEVVLLNLEVADSIAGTYNAPGGVQDDLRQVARLGLVKAVDRYDVEAGGDFLAFAVPTVRGEVRRYFRDHYWTIRPSRRVQEIHHAIQKHEPALTQRLGRAPTIVELAEEIGIGESDVIETLAADSCFNPVSLELQSGWSDRPQMVLDTVGEDDRNMEWLEAHLTLAPALESLSEREKLLLRLRFEKGWTQSQIGAAIGVSQMQASRLLRNLLAHLRELLEGQE